MKLITKHTDYAVRAVLYLAGRQTEFISSREIAGRNKIPLPFLRRILQVLIREGVIDSREGVEGGVLLSRKPEEIKISDLIRLFQGEIQLSECMFRKKICRNRSTCVLRRRIQGMEKKLASEFQKITIRTLLKDLKTDVRYDVKY